ncbi:6-hydroxymethylpterin diphosphokinase MptE-like protein [Pseudobutyrivibrio ruminis]|uniref:6-hydroxymethylpterin diphosphokinase MptE-like protein n=1 Tax=Pseudobutyrivibrio ruminis TaxID=46206 RepID=UPI00068B086D|nr:6-hydroxymethylpterin diphosphokinase MptE-like protein [Pseudobutyrivibrio ruminis]
MNNKFVVWGTGYRTKKLVDIIGLDHIKVFIDNNITKQQIGYEGIKVISFEDYKREYRNYGIIVCPIYDEDEIVSQLESEEIYHYLLLSMNPSEIQGYGIKDYVQRAYEKIDRGCRNIIIGDNLFTYLLYEKAHRVLNDNQIGICSDNLQNEKQFKAISKMLGCNLIAREDIQPTDRVLLAIKDREYYTYNYENIYDMSKEIPDYYNDKILSLKDTHLGETCFVVATGPSLLTDDLLKLKANGVYSFGVNRIFNIDAEYWKPNCYVFIDKKGIEDYSNEIENYQIETKCLNADTKNIFKDDGCNYFMHVAVHDHYDLQNAFSENVESVVYGGGTVVYAAIQIAVYMGFKKIYLLGVDCNYEKNSNDNYFFKTEKPDILNHDVRRMFDNFEIAKKYADEKDIKIYNATRGGMLEVFERVDFDTLFK